MQVEDIHTDACGFREQARKSRSCGAFHKYLFSQNGKQGRSESRKAEFSGSEDPQCQRERVADGA